MCGIDEVVVPEGTQEDWGCSDGGQNEGVLFAVTKTVTLLEIARSFRFPSGGGSVTFGVYESTTAHGNYTRVFSSGSGVTSAPAFRQFVSGAANLTLTSGKFYLFTTSCDGSANYCVGAVVKPTAARPTSFGYPMEWLNLGCLFRPSNTTYVYSAIDNQGYWATPLEFWTSP